MKINKLNSFTKERIANSKLTLFINLIASFLINLLLIISLASNGIAFGYVIFPILICLFDVTFFVISIFTNYKFSYSTLYTALFAGIFTITSGAYAIFLLDVLSTERAVAITYISLGLWAIASIISVISILFGVSKAGKRCSTFSAILSVLLLFACVGAYAYHITEAGFFGQGENAAQRPIAFVYDEENDYYIAKTLVSGKGSSATIPETFNGVKVGAVDFELLSANKLKTLTFSTSDIVFTNVSALSYAPSSLEIYAPKEHISGLLNQIYTIAHNTPSVAGKLVNIARCFAPNDLGADDVIILFQYSEEYISKTDGSFIPAWLGKTGEVFGFEFANYIDYVKDSNRDDESLLAKLYVDTTNNGGYIMSDLKDQTGASVNGKKITERLNTVDVTFDKIYRLQIADDNDSVYEIEDEFKYLSGSNKYRYVTLSSSESLLNDVHARPGFSLAWSYSDPNGNMVNSFNNLTALLESSETSDVRLHPEWTLDLPSINVCKTESGELTFTYGDDFKLISEATAPIEGYDLAYEWKRNGTVIATTDSFDVSKVQMYEAGSYVLTVTASSSNVTSLTSKAKQVLDIQVNKKELPISWVGFDGGEEFSITYTSQDFEPGISYDPSALVSDDQITYDFDVTNFKNAGKYNVTVSLSGDCNGKYFISASNIKKEYTINKKAIDLLWTDVDYTYSAAEIAPSVSISSGICLGDDLGVSTVGQTYPGKYQAEAKLQGEDKENYEIKKDQSTHEYTIIPATLNINWSNIEQVYTSKNLMPTAEVIGLKGNDTLESLKLTIDCKNAKNVGSYTATAGITNKNYVIADTDRTTTLVITPAELTLSFSNVIKTYSAEDLRPTYRVTAGKCSGDSEADLKITVASAKNAGTHTLEVSVGNPNYKLSLNSQTIDFTINPMEVEVTWNDNKALTYSGEEQYLGIKSSKGIFSADNAKVKVEVDAARSKNINASKSEYTSYAILTGDETLIANYKIKETTASANYTIKPKELTIEWGSTSFTYDQQGHCPTAKIVTGICGEDIVNLTVEGTAINATKKATATASIDNDNYTLKNATKDFVINPKSLTITWSNLEFTYDGTTHKPTASINSGIIDGDTVELSLTGAKAAGNHTSVASISNTNYSLSNSSQSFTIDPKEINVNWTDGSFTYNGNVQAPTATVQSGVLPGDTVSLKVTGAKDAGNHTATVTSSNTNYVVSEATATHAFTISKKTVSVSFTKTEKTYTGSALLPDVTIVGKVNADNVKLNYTVTGYPDGAVDVGTYTIKVSTENTNYILDPATVTLESFKITPKVLTITWSKTTLTYNGKAQKPVATLNGVVSGDNVQCDVSLNGEGINVGSYTATASINDSNYVLSESSNTTPFEITALEITVSWNMSAGSSLTANGSEQAPKATAGDLALNYSYEKYNESTGKFEVMSGKPQTAGRYRVTVSTNSSNHTLSNQSLEYSIVAPKTAD